jgi:hypothetical protein
MSKKLLVTVLVLVSLMFSVQDVFANVVLDPSQVNVECDNNFDLHVLVDTGDSKLGAVDFLLTFDPDVIEVDTTQGDNGIDKGSDAEDFTFIPAPNPGQLVVVGFSVNGIGPGNSLDLLVIHFKALPDSKVCSGDPFPINLEVRNYADEEGNPIDPGTVLGSEVTITCPQICSTLNVSVNPQDGGSITDNKNQISCPNDCTGGYVKGDSVTLTASPNTDYQFLSWEGDCNSCVDNPVCDIVMDTDKECRANFNNPIIPEYSHYLSYKVKQTRGTPKFELFTVTLDDQFERKDFRVVRPSALYNPAEKTFGDIVEPPVDFDTHLVGYKIAQAKKSCVPNAPENPGRECRNGADCGGEKKDRTLCRPTPRLDRQIVKIDNQFGTTLVTTILPELLLLPSSKNLDGDAPPLDPVDLDHYKCYRVKEIRNRCEHDPSVRCREDVDCTLPDGTAGICNKGLTKNLTVALSDQFGQKKAFSLRSNRLCTPVEKTTYDVNGEPTVTPIMDEENHYMCYIATLLKKACIEDSPKPYTLCKVESQCGGTIGVTNFCQRQDRHERREGVAVTNQFGENQLIDTIKEENLCVPSKKTVFNENPL